jgi:hypothetical protein
MNPSPDLSNWLLQQVVEEIFEGAGLSAPPWPDNPAWDFTASFYICCCQFDSLGEVLVHIT